MRVEPGALVHMDENGATTFPHALLPQMLRACARLQREQDARIRANAILVAISPQIFAASSANSIGSRKLVAAIEPNLKLLSLL